MVLALSLSDELTETLRRHAELTGRSMEQVAMTAIEEYPARANRAKALTELRELGAEGGFDLELHKDKRNYRR